MGDMRGLDWATSALEFTIDNGVHHVHVIFLAHDPPLDQQSWKCTNNMHIYYHYMSSMATVHTALHLPARCRCEGMTRTARRTSHGGLLMLPPDSSELLELL